MFDRCRENSSDGSLLHSPPDKKGSLSHSARGPLTCPGSTLGFQPPSWLSGAPLSSGGPGPSTAPGGAHALRLGNATIFPAQPRHPPPPPRGCPTSPQAAPTRWVLHWKHACMHERPYHQHPRQDVRHSQTPPTQPWPFPVKDASRHASDCHRHRSVFPGLGPRGRRSP